MLILRKIINYKVAILLLLLTSLLFMGVSSFNRENFSSFSNEMKTNDGVENITDSLLPENNGQICDSSTGICGPPPGWYKKYN